VGSDLDVLDHPVAVPFEARAFWHVLRGCNHPLFVDLQPRGLGSLLRPGAFSRSPLLLVIRFFAGLLVELTGLEARAFLLALEHRDLIFQEPNFFLLTPDDLDQLLDDPQQPFDQRGLFLFRDVR